MDDLERGHHAIQAAIEGLPRPVVLIEQLRMFGDVLHSTIVVRQFRSDPAHRSVVWAISERYVETFAGFSEAELGPHRIVGLPHGPTFPGDRDLRVPWVHGAAEIEGVRALGVGVHPWGWKRGSLVDAILLNAGIGALKVPRRPWCPLLPEDESWASAWLADRGLDRFVALEHVSHSIASLQRAWLEEFVRIVGIPVVALGAADDPEVPSAIDGRGTTYRQAKALIRRSACFVGCGSGLSVLAASDRCEQPVFEVTPHALSMAYIGYRELGRRYLAIEGASPRVAATSVRQISLHRRTDPKPCSVRKRRSFTVRSTRKR